MKIFLSFIASLAAIGLMGGASAQPAEVKTPAPVIYLADNLDEPDGLGWCIDTQGRGFAEKLHAHSCKPRGGDVQFRYDEEQQAIASVAFEGKCLSLNEAEAGAEAGAETQFGLFDCDQEDANQGFVFDPETGVISTKSDANKCVGVGESIRKAGPFSSRDLVLATCADIDDVYKTWVFAR